MRKSFSGSVKGLQFQKRHVRRLDGIKVINLKHDSRRRKKERTEDALASIGEEGRGKLRKAAGIGKHELIRGCPNGGTRQVEDLPPFYGANPGN